MKRELGPVCCRMSLPRETPQRSEIHLRFHEFKRLAQPDVVVPLMTAFERQRQSDLGEFEASLFNSEFQDSQCYAENPCLENIKFKKRRVEVTCNSDTML